MGFRSRGDAAACNKMSSSLASSSTLPPGGSRRACARSRAGARGIRRAARRQLVGSQAVAIRLEVARVQHLLELAADGDREHRAAQVDRLAHQREAGARDHPARGAQVVDEAVLAERAVAQVPLDDVLLEIAAQPVDAALAARAREDLGQRACSRSRSGRRAGGRPARARAARISRAQDRRVQRRARLADRRIEERRDEVVERARAPWP